MTDRRPRVLHVIPGLGSGGGAERSLLGTAPLLSQELDELHVAILSDRRALVDPLERLGVVVHDLSHATGTLARVRAVHQVIAAVRPDVVHASLFDADVPTQIAVGRRRPLIVTWAGTPFTPELRGSAGITWWKVQIVRLAEMLLGVWARPWYQAVTDGVARSNASALRVRSGRVVVAERGRPAPIAVTADRRRAVRSGLGIEDHHQLLLSVARHEPEKGLAVLIAAMAEVARAHPTLRLVVAGREGSMTDRLRADIERAGLDSVVHLLGHRTDVDDLLHAADLFVSPSVSEGAAGAVLEAMAVGLPIVASDAVGMRGVLDDGVDALVAPVGDHVALGAAILEVAGDPGLAGRLGAAARTTFGRRYEIDQSARALLAMYVEVAGVTG